MPTLEQAVHTLHDMVADVRFPLDLPGTEKMRAEQHRVLRLLESYAMPRLAGTDNPLIVVIGGATGAGKSTITNSLVGREASPSGIIRPTTRQPVLIYHPADGPALHALGLFRAPSQSGGPDASRWIQLRATPSEDLPPGLTIIDSPDLDSRVDGNRELAARLLDVADLWLFVTTGTDYADAMSWDLLAQAAQRQVALAVVLNRLRPRESAPVRDHFAALLTSSGLAHAHVFTLPETALIDGRIPLHTVRSLRGWLIKRAQDDAGRRQMVDRAFDGTLEQSIESSQELARGLAEQLVVVQHFHSDLDSAFSSAREVTRQRASHAMLVREDLITAWRTVNSHSEASGPRGSHSESEQKPGGMGLFRRREQRQPAADRYLAVGRSLNTALTEALRAQVTQTLRNISDRWGPLGDVPVDGFGAIADIPDDFNDRVAAATLSWLGSVQSRLRAAGVAPVVEIHPTVDPLALALASLAVEGRPGRTVPLDAESANRSERLLEELTIALSDLMDHAQLAPLLRDAWLDLLSVMNTVLNRDHARLTGLLTALPLSAELPEALIQAAQALRTAERAPETPPATLTTPEPNPESTQSADPLDLTPDADTGPFARQS